MEVGFNTSGNKIFYNFYKGQEMNNIKSMILNLFGIFIISIILLALLGFLSIPSALGALLGSVICTLAIGFYQEIMQ